MRNIWYDGFLGKKRSQTKPKGSWGKIVKVTLKDTIARFNMKVGRH